MAGLQGFDQVTALPPAGGPSLVQEEPCVCPGSTGPGPTACRGHALLLSTSASGEQSGKTRALFLSSRDPVVKTKETERIHTLVKSLLIYSISPFLTKMSDSHKRVESSLRTGREGRNG